VHHEALAAQQTELLVENTRLTDREVVAHYEGNKKPEAVSAPG
jgi:hypothetical protein